MSKQKTILVTGAGGSLGNELIEQLSQRKKYKILPLTSNKEKLLSRFSHIKQLEVYSVKDWKDGNVPWDKINVIIHCAFATALEGEELANSLNFTRTILEDAKKGKVSSVINISSRSVYGNKHKPLWKETTPVCPETSYAMAKYSSELLVKSIALKDKAAANFTNIRLSSLIGDGQETRVVTKFVQNSLEDQTIKIIGGKQIFSYLDVRDAASGIIALLSIEPSKWDEVYNLGSDQRYSIIEIAEIVSDVAREYTGVSIKIEIEEREVALDIGMDSGLFYEHTGWMPQYSMRDTVESLFEHFSKIIRG